MGRVRSRNRRANPVQLIVLNNNKSKPKRRKRKPKHSRWAAYRRRQRAHVIVLRVPIDDVVLDWLVREARWISKEAADAADRQVLGQLIADGLKLSAAKATP